MSSIQIQQKNPACPQCRSTYTVKKGKRRNRLQTVPLYLCNECTHRFSGTPGKHKTYPLKIILEAISAYNLGHSLTDTQRILRQRAHLDVPERTIRSWLGGHKPLLSYSRLRTAGKKLFDATTILRSFIFDHQQVYRFQIHQGKLELLLPTPAHQHLLPVKQYLGSVSRDFPHQLFQTTEHRSSKFLAELRPPIAWKENYVTRLAGLMLPISPTNKKRHEILQRFMLINDSVTVAVEIPVFLTREDIAHYRKHGFNLGFESDIITGHIDFIQVRNGYLHILDYKPEAKKETHAHVQLTIYALALSRRAGLPLKHFKCAWFDDRDYFEFFPLQGVYKSNTNEYRS